MKRHSAVGEDLRSKIVKRNKSDLFWQIAGVADNTKSSREERVYSTMVLLLSLLYISAPVLATKAFRLQIADKALNNGI